MFDENIDYSRGNLNFDYLNLRNYLLKMYNQDNNIF
jgi:hypothetical protein